MELHNTKIDLAKGKREKLVAILNHLYCLASAIKHRLARCHLSQSLRVVRWQLCHTLHQFLTIPFDLFR